VDLRPEIIIFCQAPADVPYLLDLHSRHINKRISVFVINVVGIYKFLVSLDLKLYQLIFIEYANVDFKNPFSIIKEKIRIKNIKIKYFYNTKGISIFFFSRFEDWLTASLISSLAHKNNQIFYVNHYDISADSHPLISKVKFSRRILGLLFNYISGVKLLVNREFKFPEFPISKYNIIELNPEIDDDIFIKYAIHVNNVNKSKISVIFFISPIENDLYDSEDYSILILKIFEFLNDKGIDIYVKGHPRCGYPLFINSEIVSTYNLSFVDSFIPGEFIDMSSFSLCLGFDSTILSILSKKSIINTLCLIDLVKISNFNSYYFLKDYMLKFSGGKLLFIQDLNEIDLYLNENI
jgi:hypothetical protein